jgi:hypothetical protein
LEFISNLESTEVEFFNIKIIFKVDIMGNKICCKCATFDSEVFLKIVRLTRFYNLLNVGEKVVD